MHAATILDRPFIYPELPKSPERSSEGRIRLIGLKSELDGSQLACVLYSAGLSEAPDLGSSLGQFAVQPTLHTALSQLRLHDQSRRLWVDAICIDQADLDERSRQAALMRDIFAEARRVLGSHGKADDMTATALALVERIAAACDGKDKTHLESPLGMPHGLPPDLQFEDIGDADIEAILGLFASSSIWERAWIAQEIASSKEAAIVIGDHSVEWYKFGLCAAWITGFKRLSSTLVHGPDSKHNSIANAAWLWRHQQKAEPSAIMLLHVFMAAWKCTDVRDMIYAFVGFEAMQREMPTMPDYSLPVKGVYLLAFRSHVENAGTLRFLQLLHHRPDIEDGDDKICPPDGFPSWLPDLRLEVHAHVPDERLLTDLTRLCDLPSAQLTKDSWSGDVLSIKGLYGERITMTPDDIGMTEDDGGAARALLSFVESACTVARIAPELLHSLAYAMTGGFGLDQNAADTDAETVNRHAEYFQAALIPLQELHDGPHIPLPDQLGFKDSNERQLMKAYADAFLIVTGLATHNRRLFMGASGYIGVGPAITKPGDDVLVLFGSFLPIISRRLDGDRRQVVGHAASYHIIHDRLRDWQRGTLTDVYFTFL